MDSESQQRLAQLIHTQRVAALGTLRDGAPFISMILYAPSADFTNYFMHVSRLAFHTQDILKDPRVSLMIAEADAGTQNPQLLARVSIRGEAILVQPADPEYEKIKSLYLAKFPENELNFGLGDFAIYRIQVKNARYVAGFARAFNLSVDDFKKAAELKGLSGF